MYQFLLFFSLSTLFCFPPEKIMSKDIEWGRAWLMSKLMMEGVYWGDSQWPTMGYQSPGDFRMLPLMRVAGVECDSLSMVRRGSVCTERHGLRRSLTVSTWG